MHATRLGLAGLEKAKRLRDRHLEYENLMFAEGRLRDAMPGLNDGCIACACRCAHARCLDEEISDRHRVGGVVGTLIDYLEYIVRAEDGCSHLHSACPPAVRHRHFTAGERHLISGNGYRLEDGAADHALGLLIQIGKIVDRRVHSAASWRDEAPARSCSNSERRRRKSPSSA